MRLDEGRWMARLSQLSRESLLTLAARGCTADAATANVANQQIAAECPLPLWAISDVLLSPDLLPKLLAPLSISNPAPALVCRTWRDAWVHRVDARAALRHDTMVQMQNLWNSVFSMRACGKQLLVETIETGLSCVQLHGQTPATFGTEVAGVRDAIMRVLHVSGDLIYCSERFESIEYGEEETYCCVVKRRYPGFELLHNSDSSHASQSILNGVVCGGLLYTTETTEIEEGVDELLIRAYNMESLKVVRQWYPGFSASVALSAYKSTLFVGEDIGQRPPKIRCISLESGELLDTITMHGESQQAANLLVHGGRLYAAARSDRIQVFSATSPHNLIQVCTGEGPPGQSLQFFAMCVVEDTLLVSHNPGFHEDDDGDHERVPVQIHSFLGV